jgi:CheY-like chemotaxis protein
MDIQMLVMDGYAATRKLRKDARFTEIPIIAMTANVMAGDRDKALDAGMNDHVAKPIDVKDLFEVLERWVRLPETRRGRQPKSQETDPSDHEALPEIPGIDTKAGLARVGGSIPVYRKILMKFRESQRDAPQRIRAALVAADRETARREAHTLKGVAGNIGAQRVQAAAGTVEVLVSEGTECDEALYELERSLAALIAGMPLSRRSRIAPRPGAISPSIEKLNTLLDRLHVLLEDSDTEACEVIDEIESHTEDGQLRTQIESIRQFIDDFRFDEAVTALGEFRKEMASLASFR